MNSSTGWNPLRLAILCATLLAASRIDAQWKYPGCEDVTNASFKYDVMVQRGQPSDSSLDEPVKMAFDMDAAGTVDIYYVERKGKAKVFRGATGKSEVLGTFTVDEAHSRENGLTGIALDPDFKRNRWIYFFYTPATPFVFRLSRFTLVGATLDKNSEKILMQFPQDKAACCHTGGAMAFDAYGDLWIAVGGNGTNKGPPVDEVNISYSEEDGSANTADYRGGVLRIHPDDSPKGYSIPKGNFGDYFASKMADAGLAAQYRDTALVKPEIYIKGCRNPYTLTLDPVRRWATIGDVGPDNHALMEEHNLFKTPVFAGWPYFAGKNLGYAGDKNPAAPVNLSKWNTGVKTLPPATPSIRSYPTATAMTGPIYRYDGASRSTVKLPPHFQRKWFITENLQNWIHVITLDSAGENILKEEPIFQNRTFYRPIDMEQGPDGALYVINYAGYFSTSPNTSIVRISYPGTCRPAQPELEKPIPTGLQGGRTPMDGSRRMVFPILGGGGEIELEAGTRSVELYDARGKKVWEAAAVRGQARIRIPEALGRGLFQVRMLP